tara:strand:- start:3731 stop:4015 length:285 start_codon:yes stop_codon:yes gene_type:complete
MPIQHIHWEWEEAFNKFGFGDGDGWNGTHLVEEFLLNIGCKEVECNAWGIHNYMIFRIVDEDGKEYEFDGYEDSYNILPESIIKKLNKEFLGDK